MSAPGVSAPRWDPAAEPAVAWETIGGWQQTSVATKP